MLLLDSPVRHDSWGSRTAIARLQGRPTPSSEPEAAIVMGDPSRVAGIRLDKYIAASAPSVLGPESVNRFGLRLPYRVAFLAAGTSSSIQVHPDEKRALARFLAEDRAPIARHDPHRTYRDPHHRPELLVAHTRCEILCGFRDPREAAADLRTLHVSVLQPVIDALEAGNLRLAVAALLAWPYSQRAEDMATVIAARNVLPPHQADLITRLASTHPDDPGVIIALMLRQEFLEPGEAMFIRAGQLHCYVSGAAIQAAASSTNVIRGGLTDKRVAVDELLSTVDLDVASDPRVEPLQLTSGIVTWPVPVNDFRLHRVSQTGDDTMTTLSIQGPRLAFCASGSVDVSDASGSVRLSGGAAAFGPADGGEMRLSGKGEVFIASA